jgi:AraC family transcriptional regulator
MSHAIKLQAVPLTREKSLFTLVENRTTYSLENCELNVFETHQKAENVNLAFGDLVLTSMLRGKKVMHLFDQPGFDYLPGESVIVPPSEVMRIDFPEARPDNPTQCIALAISNEMIRKTLEVLNDKFPKASDGKAWDVDYASFHLDNNRDLADIINRFIRISTKEFSKEKDIIAELALRELLIRLMQTQAREIMEKSHSQLAGNNRLAFVVQFIKSNLRENITIDQLSDKACMSKPHFYRCFKEELGISPAEFILQERLKMAKEYLKNPRNQVTQVCYMAGFNNPNYFIRAFKADTGMAPKVFQNQFIS